ncbi:MAG: isochorismatase family protein [Deltaproteobacteria bacterium]|nr:isochorismatase family protein [Deltaproteobacteria bacterium]
MDCAADPRDTLLLLLGLQDRLLARLGSAGTQVTQRARQLVLAATRAGVPVAVVHAAALGVLPRTLDDACRAAAATFSDANDGPGVSHGVLAHLEASRRRRVVVAGAESHVGVFLAAREIHQDGFITLVPHDACASRRPADHDAALHLCRQAGVAVTTTETLLHEWLLPTHAEELHRLLQETAA